jgi:pyruvate,water dikinase
MENRPIYTLDFCQIGLNDVARVGGKNASLGELFNSFKPFGVNVLYGFVITADSYRRLLNENSLESKLKTLFSDFNYERLKN